VRPISERLVTDSKLDAVSGRYYDRLREARANNQAYDRESRASIADRTVRSG